MSAINNSPATFDEAGALAILQCLREAGAEAIETKRKLGQYWVVNTPDGPRFEGPGAPALVLSSR
jgi:hypothetical protein